MFLFFFSLKKVEKKQESPRAVYIWFAWKLIINVFQVDSKCLMKSCISACRVVNQNEVCGKAWILEEQISASRNSSVCTQGGYWGCVDMMLWVLWLLFLHVLCVGLCSIKVAGNQTCTIFVFICLLLVSGREIRSPKWNVRGFNHWMGQILSIKEEWFIALREICHLSERWSAVPAFRNNSPRQVESSRLFICCIPNRCIVR